MANEVVFDRQYLIDKDLPYSALEDKITGHGRWSVQHEIIFEDNGKYYSTGYSEGATEMQPDEPWEYDDQVECVEVHQVERLVKVWEDVPWQI